MHDELLQTRAHLDLELMANGAHPARANDQQGQGTPKKHDRALVVIDEDGHQSTLIIPPALLVTDMHACRLAGGDRILLLLPLISNVVALGK